MSRKNRKKIVPNLTPLIDVIFLLLIFFLVSSVFKQDKSALKLMLPEINSQENVKEVKNLFIELNNEQLAVNGEITTIEALKELAKNIENKSKPVSINIDEKTEYKKVSAVLDILQLNKLCNIQFVSKQAKDMSDY